MNSPISTQRTIRRYPGVGWRDEGKREKEREREMSRGEVPEDFSVTSCLILGQIMRLILSAPLFTSWSDQRTVTK